jgi:hypothetical protein
MDGRGGARARPIEPELDRAHSRAGIYSLDSTRASPTDLAPLPPLSPVKTTATTTVPFQLSRLHPREEPTKRRPASQPALIGLHAA